jgi:hypothetical protein
MEADPMVKTKKETSLPDGGAVLLLENGPDLEAGPAVQALRSGAGHDPAHCRYLLLAAWPDLAVQPECALDFLLLGHAKDRVALVWPTMLGCQAVVPTNARAAKALAKNKAPSKPPITVGTVFHCAGRIKE